MRQNSQHVFKNIIDIQSSQVECAADARWTPRPLHGGTIMPRCIRKLTIEGNDFWEKQASICWSGVFLLSFKFRGFIVETNPIIRAH